MSGPGIRWVAGAFLAALVACGGRDSGNHVIVRDSAGVAILAYPASVLDSAPRWTLSASPLVVLGGDSADATMDLSTAVAATLLADGRAAVFTGAPPELLLFDATGNREARLGSPGDGPGEYHNLTPLLPFGTDTLFAFDAGQRKGLLFATNGMPLGERTVPSIVSAVPPVLRGRLSDGTLVLSLDRAYDPPPEGTFKRFRNPLFVLGLKDAAPRYDTLLTTQGSELVPSTVMADGRVAPMARPLIFGGSTQIAVGGSQWYVSRADSSEIETRDASGKLLRVLRLALPTRPVGPVDQEKYKATVREAYDQMKGRVPAEVLAGELKKLDETAFADHLPAISQVLADRDGNIWVNRGFSLIDRFRSWIVFNPEGQLIGRVDTPLGSVLSILPDKVLVGRRSGTTGRVRLEIYGLTRNTPEPTRPDSAGR